MKIIFQKVKFKNFLSFGNTFTEIDLLSNSKNLIIGPNGIGKSCILDVITFALFSKPFRKINKPQIVNSINKKDCVTEIEFIVGTHQYTIIRGLKPAIFEIYKS